MLAGLKSWWDGFKESQQISVSTIDKIWINVHNYIVRVVIIGVQ